MWLNFNLTSPTVSLSCNLDPFPLLLVTDCVHPHVETIDETTKGNKLLRERSTLSSREGTTLSRQGTLTSLKKQGSNLSGKKVATSEDSKGNSTKEEKPFLVTKQPSSYRKPH